MANFDAPDLTYKNQHFHVYGNKAVAFGKIPAIQPQIGDVLRLARIPRGSRLTGDAWFSHSIVGPASSLGDFGFTHVDGSAGDDPDYFSTSPVDLTATGKHDADAGLEPVTLTKDAYLTLTITGANFVANTDFWANADYESVGLP